MTAGDWTFIKDMAAESGVTLRQAGVNRRQRLGYAIDCILAALDQKAHL